MTPRARPQTYPMFRVLSLAASVVATLALGACASAFRESDNSLLGLITPYRIEIVQGNVVTQEQASRLREGMNRLQVRDILGTPLLADPFHAERWDYLFTIRRQGAAPQRRSIIVHFDGDRVSRFELPELPSEKDFVASITPPREFEPRKLALTDEERAALPVPPPIERPEAEPSGPVRSYPPLEPAR